LNTITILGFVYLPASFVATLLSTQYISIHTDADGGHVSISFARELWIFVILTVVLLVVTAGSWVVWERHNQLADHAEAERRQKAV
jgi:heme/copper-type cytochrome/quinol oxidase subunit 2